MEPDEEYSEEWGAIEMAAAIIAPLAGVTFSGIFIAWSAAHCDVPGLGSAMETWARHPEEVRSHVEHLRSTKEKGNNNG